MRRLALGLALAWIAGCGAPPARQEPLPAAVVAPASEDPTWVPPFEVVAVGSDDALEVLGRALPDEAEVTGRRWGVRARYLTPGLTAWLRTTAVPGLWLTSATDEDLDHVAALRSLRWLSVVGHEVSDAGLARLRGLGDLEALELGDWYGCERVTGAGLAHVATLRRLRRLALRGTATGGEELGLLADLPHLVELDLKRTVVAPEGLEALARLRGLEALDLCATRIGDAGLTRLTGLTGLRTLDLSLCPVTDAGVRALSALPALEALRLYRCGLTDAAGPHLAALRGLFELNLGHCEAIGDEALRQIAQLPRLETLGVEFTRVTGRGLEALAPLTRLRSLGLGGGLDAAALEHVGALRALESIQAQNLHERAETLLRVAASLPALRSLDLVRCTVPGEAIAALGSTTLERLRLFDSNGYDGAGLSNLTGLRTLDISTRDLTPVALQALRGLPSLRSLCVSGVDDAALSALGELPALRELELEGSPRVTAEGIARLEARRPACAVVDRLWLGPGPYSQDARGLDTPGLDRVTRLERRITSLTLTPEPDHEDGEEDDGGGVDDGGARRDFACLRVLPRVQELAATGLRITDELLVALEGVPGLRSLDLSDCQLLTAAGLAHLRSLSSLQRLALRRSPALDDEGARWVSALPSLQALDASGCAALGDDGVRRLAALARLETLNLRGCARITDAALEPLAGLQRLETLDLLDCPRLTPGGVGRLRKALPGCTIAYTDPTAAFADAMAVGAAFDAVPSWHPLGGDVYQSSAAEAAAAELLAPGAEPRWFHAKGAPRHPHELPAEKDTARLTVDPHVSATGEVELELVLTSDVPISRAVEHRFTNVLPFLVALSVDGVSVARPWQGFGREGGMPGAAPLIVGARGGAKRWRVRVDPASLAALAGLADRAARLALVVAFSDSQHDGFGRDDEHDAGVLVRSQPVFLTWNGESFEPD